MAHLITQHIINVGEPDVPPKVSRFEYLQLGKRVIIQPRGHGDTEGRHAGQHYWESLKDMHPKDYKVGTIVANDEHDEDMGDYLKNVLVDEEKEPREIHSCYLMPVEPKERAITNVFLYPRLRAIFVQLVDPTHCHYLGSIPADSGDSVTFFGGEPTRITPPITDTKSIQEDIGGVSRKDHELVTRTMVLSTRHFHEKRHQAQIINLALRRIHDFEFKSLQIDEKASSRRSFSRLRWVYHQYEGMHWVVAADHHDMEWCPVENHVPKSAIENRVQLAPFVDEWNYRYSSQASLECCNEFALMFVEGGAALLQVHLGTRARVRIPMPTTPSPIMQPLDAIDSEAQLFMEYKDHKMMVIRHYSSELASQLSEGIKKTPLKYLSPPAEGKSEEKSKPIAPHKGGRKRNKKLQNENERKASHSQSAYTEYWVDMVHRTLQRTVERLQPEARKELVVLLTSEILAESEASVRACLVQNDPIMRGTFALEMAETTYYTRKTRIWKVLAHGSSEEPIVIGGFVPSWRVPHVNKEGVEVPLCKTDFFDYVQHRSGAGDDQYSVNHSVSFDSLDFQSWVGYESTPSEEWIKSDLFRNALIKCCVESRRKMFVNYELNTAAFSKIVQEVGKKKYFVVDDGFYLLPIEASETSADQPLDSPLAAEQKFDAPAFRFEPFSYWVERNLDELRKMDGSKSAARHNWKTGEKFGSCVILRRHETLESEPEGKNDDDKKEEKVKPAKTMEVLVNSSGTSYAIHASCEVNHIISGPDNFISLPAQIILNTHKKTFSSLNSAEDYAEFRALPLVKRHLDLRQTLAYVVRGTRSDAPTWLGSDQRMNWSRRHDSDDRDTRFYLDRLFHSSHLSEPVDLRIGVNVGVGMDSYRSTNCVSSRELKMFVLFDLHYLKIVRIKS